MTVGRNSAFRSLVILDANCLKGGIPPINVLIILVTICLESRIQDSSVCQFFDHFLCLLVIMIVLEPLVCTVLLVVLPQQIKDQVYSNTFVNAHADLVVAEVNLIEFHLYLCIEVFKSPTTSG